jgi:hypothetical protein
VAAVVDTAFTGIQLERSLGGLKSAEIHSVTYLACLLSIYDGHLPDEWEYSYTSTKAGAPFSTSIDEAVGRMLATRTLTTDGQLLTPSEKGHQIFEQLKMLPSLHGRERFLEAACGVTLMMPLPTVTEAVLHEPQLQAAVALGQLRPLLDETGLAVIRPHIEGLRLVLQEEETPRADLLVPAALWLSYLSRSVPEAVVDSAV